MSGLVRQEFSVAFRPLFETSARYILLWGGRGRGGSYTATQYFLNLITRATYFRGYFMRMTFGDIRESLWQDFKDRIEENQTINPRAIDLNESRMIAKCRTTGNLITSKGFRKTSKDRTAKLKSLAGGTHVIIEEAEEISETDFMQLDDTLRSIKAKVQIILIFNPPPKNHWIWRKWFVLVAAPRPMDIAKKDWGYFRAIPKSSQDLLSIFSTYQSNLKNIDASTLRIWKEYRTTMPDHYWTVIMGLISEGARGRIYKTWQICKKMPGIHAKFYGLDWGFSGDPLALVEMEAHNRQLWADEKIYERGLLNDDLERKLIELGISKRAPIIADSAQPKDIEDMKKRGWNFIAAIKGPGSVRSGIKFLQQFATFVTERSSNMWEEVKNYAWALDQHKEPTNEPIDAHNHAMDAMNYGADKLRNPGGLTVVKGETQALRGTTRNEYNA